MRRSLNLFFFFSLSCFLFSCQKEKSFELGQASRGSLQSFSGDCLPKNVSGTYKTSQTLIDSNYIDVTVNVGQVGSYIIATDTLNGYWFRTTGNFTTAGSNTVRLKGFGTPSTAGVNNFTVRYDTTNCNVPVTVISSGGGGSGGSAVFTLQGNGSNCMNSSVAGTYTQSTPLGSTNKVTIQVNVTTIGTWTMSTNSVDSFSFTGSGTFATTGVQTVTLNGSGTPTSTGTQTFSVSAGSSSCTFSVSVVPNTAPPAVFTLQGSPGTCMSFTLNGTYTQGTALTSTNNVVIQVNVTTAGTWTVTTNTVDGMTFSGTGTFGAAGIQTITLNGTGTPATSGAQTFTVTAGSSSCTFIVTVTASAPSTDHFILTNNSWWSYSTPLSSSDTLKRTIIGSATATGGFIYQVMKELNSSNAINDSLYFRKSGNNYYEFNFIDYYTSFTYDSPSPTDSILFLKEGLTTGQTWSSPVYTGKVSGVTTKVRYDFTCINANATVTLNSKTYTNVYQVTLKVMADRGSGFSTDITWTNYYAQGIGWIYQKYDDGKGVTYELPIRYYQVF